VKNIYTIPVFLSIMDIGFLSKLINEVHYGCSITSCKCFRTYNNHRELGFGKSF
jgi:hypothetical protein